MSTHRKILDQNGLNFLTFTVVDWMSLFIRPVFSDIVINSLRFCQKEKQLLLFAYVLMPNHIHLIVRTDQKPEHYLYSSASNYATGKGALEIILLDELWNDAGFVLI